MPDSTIAEALAAFCVRTRETPLPADVEARARLCVADHLHAAMHGARSDTAGVLRSYLDRDLDALAMRAESAALWSGALSAVHEIDDVHQDTSLHPGSVVVAAALAAADEAAASGARMLAGIVAGYEVAVRLSIAAGYRHYHFFHSTATCGAVGAAATASVVLGLDAQQTAHALGIAVTAASGVWEGINDEAVMIKHLHPGFAAERGVRAAKLAVLGVHAAHRAIEGDKGFLAALAQRGTHAAAEMPTREALAAILTNHLGERFAIVRNIFKRYPFCLGCFEPLEGLRHLLDTSSRRADDVAAVSVETSPSTAWMVGQADPHDQFQAKFSAPFALALVLAGHDVERAPLPAELVADPSVRRRIASIHIEGNREFGRRRAKVTVTWNDGSIASAERPFRNLDERDVWARFAAACAHYLGERGATLEREVERCVALRDVSEIVGLSRAAMTG